MLMARNRNDKKKNLGANIPGFDRKELIYEDNIDRRFILSLQ